MAVLANIVKAVSMGIDAEINGLRDDAYARIQPREVARAFINRELLNMPQLVAGKHLVGYTDERGDKQAKQQERNLSLWVVSLQTVIERGNSSYQHLGAMFVQWTKDTLGIVWDIDSAKRVAKLFINSMQDQSILSSHYSDFEYIDEATGMPMSARVFEIHKEFTPTYDTLYKQLCVNSHYVCRPLYHEPSDWVDNFTGIGERAGLQLIKGSKRTRIPKGVLKAVNKLQRVQFMIPDCIIEAAHDLLDNQHELPSTVEELMLYGEVVKYANTDFYFPMTLDSRGRMYYRGGLLSPQGTDFCKAAFQFATPKKLGDTGLDAICVHLANTLGHDKVSIDNRIAAVYAYLDSGAFDNISDHVDVTREFPNADTYQALVAILELKRIMADIESGMMVKNILSTLVCHQDGTCNGLQHMSAITMNRPTAEAVNCTKSEWCDVPKDIYGIVAEAALGFAQTQGAYDLMCKYARDMAKNPVMITGYGAGEDTIKSNISEYLSEHGQAVTCAEEIGDCYISAIKSCAGAVKAFTAAMKARIEQAVKAGATGFKWTTPDGFECDISYKDYEPARIRAGKFNALLRGVECEMDEVKTIGAMAPNFIHSLDSTHCRLVVNECAWDLVTVHDSIGSHPCNYFATNKVIREQFVMVHMQDTLGEFCESISARKPKFRGDYDVTEALESTYIFS